MRWRRERKGSFLSASRSGDGVGRVWDARIRLALLRRDLAAVERLLADANRQTKTLIRSTKLAPVTARLDALAALGRNREVEAQAVPLLRPGTYLEPFAQRALALVRRDEALLEEAVRGFEAIGLAWHARQAREIAAAAL